MSQVFQLSPELFRGLLQPARAGLAAVREWALSPPAHESIAVADAPFDIDAPTQIDARQS